MSHQKAVEVLRKHIVANIEIAVNKISTQYTKDCCQETIVQLTNSILILENADLAERGAVDEQTTNSQSLAISAMRDLIHSLDMGTDVTINAAVYKANEALKQAGI